MGFFVRFDFIFAFLYNNEDEGGVSMNLKRFGLILSLFLLITACSQPQDQTLDLETLNQELPYLAEETFDISNVLSSVEYEKDNISNFKRGYRNSKKYFKDRSSKYEGRKEDGRRVKRYDRSW